MFTTQSPNTLLREMELNNSQDDHYKYILFSFCFLKARGFKTSSSLLQNNGFKQSQGQPQLASSLLHMLCVGHVATPCSLGCLLKVLLNSSAVPSECRWVIHFTKIVSALRVEIVNCTILYRVLQYHIVIFCCYW